VVRVISEAASLLQPPSSPIIVRVLDADDQTAFDFAEVLVQAVGLSGALIAVALVLGLFAGGVIIGVRILRARGTRDDEAPSDPLSITSPPGLKS
jgi:hypothetical protein